MGVVVAFSNDDPRVWAILPEAALEARLLPASIGEPPTIQISGNRSGLLSLANLLAWASSDPAEHECVSITALPFIRVESKLSLAVLQSLGEGNVSVVRRTDLGAQFEWHVYHDELEQVALGLMNVAFTPDRHHPEYYKPELVPESEVALVIGRA